MEQRCGGIVLIYSAIILLCNIYIHTNIQTNRILFVITVFDSILLLAMLYLLSVLLYCILALKHTRALLSIM